MHIGGILVFDGPTPSLEELRSHLEERLEGLPRYRQRLSRRTAAGGLRRPEWDDDPDFDIAVHVTRAALPAPGGEDELLEWAGDFYSHRLDRSRPLWRSVLLEGLEEGRWALATKTHHCLVDGVGARDAATVMLDASPSPPPWQAPDAAAGAGPWRAARAGEPRHAARARRVRRRPRPRRSRAARRAGGRAAHEPQRAARRAPPAGRRPRRARAGQGDPRGARRHGQRRRARARHRRPAPAAARARRDPARRRAARDGPGECPGRRAPEPSSATRFRRCSSRCRSTSPTPRSASGASTRRRGAARPATRPPAAAR